ncbi:NAD(P)-dependent oxidoreductase [Breoghania sp.]|uniref:NAD-dependent epimerase/dehydratase family protein n=1 Tax=Breoghania sp. TaxID=2065378 RepID=UPI0026378C81|nr:NAD(P)-dependent oxidoreductase [Breoghania sp.]MDJ0933552.1 NAD(P)-dependent oxidoreductase [Breoghania sp.]
MGREVETLLVTGSSGRIGAAICAAAAARFKVIGVDRIPGDRTDEILDLTEDFEFLGGPVDAVAHAAGLHAPHVGLVPDDLFRRVNVAATERLALAAKAAAGASCFVFTSTTALYGVRPAGMVQTQWIDEETPPRTRTIYHHTKLEAEARLRLLTGPIFRVTMLRLERCFPEPADLMALYHLHRGVDAHDSASAHLAALEREGEDCETFIVSGTTPFERRDCAELARNAPRVLARRCPELVSAFERNGWSLPGSIDRVYDNARARARLGWQPEYGCMSVLEELCEGAPTVLAPCV